jgi:SAM-dependent methyltransferase
LAPAASDKIFDRYGHYYDLLYRDKDYQAEADYVHRLLARLGCTSGSLLLELGCGTGRHGRLLAGAGYDVSGVERSEAMIARARSGKATAGFSVKFGDIRTIRLERTFDAVAALFHVVSYQVTNDDVLSLFRTARAHVTRGGVLVFDVWYAPAVHALRPSVRELCIEDEEISIVRLAQPDWDVNQNRVDVHYAIRVTSKTTGQVTEFKEVHSMRYFSLPELDLFASASDFNREVAEEFLSGASPSERSWSVCLAFRAI